MLVILVTAVMDVVGLSAAAFCSSVQVHFVLGGVTLDPTLGENIRFPLTVVRISGRSCAVHAVHLFRSDSSAMSPFHPTPKL